MIQRTRLLHLYYLVTPAFAILDLVLGASFRAAGIASPAWRAAYYAFALGCWVAMRRWPRATPLIGIGESSVNLLLLVLSVLGPIFAAPGVIAAGGEPALAFGAGKLVNLLLAGSILVLGFQRHQTALAANLARRGDRR